VSEHCPTCGAEVRVVGRTTLHYEAVEPLPLTVHQIALIEEVRDFYEAEVFEEGDMYEQRADALLAVLDRLGYLEQRDV